MNMEGVAVTNTRQYSNTTKRMANLYNNFGPAYCKTINLRIINYSPLCYYIKRTESISFLSNDIYAMKFKH